VVLVAVETGQAVTTAIWTRLTTDAALQAALGGSVSLYRVMAPQDPAMPYGVQRLASRDAFHGTHTYLLDWWDYGETPERVDLAVDRTKILLHEWRFVTAYGEAEGLLSFFSGGYIPTDNEKVFHYATQWDIRFVACRDVTNIVGA
jgi:hypothetical protein